MVEIVGAPPPSEPLPPEPNPMDEINRRLDEAEKTDPLVAAAREIRRMHEDTVLRIDKGYEFLKNGVDVSQEIKARALAEIAKCDDLIAQRVPMPGDDKPEEAPQSPLPETAPPEKGDAS